MYLVYSWVYMENKPVKRNSMMTIYIWSAKGLLLLSVWKLAARYCLWYVWWGRGDENSSCFAKTQFFLVEERTQAKVFCMEESTQHEIDRTKGVPCFLLKDGNLTCKIIFPFTLSTVQTTVTGNKGQSCDVCLLIFWDGCQYFIRLGWS